MSKKIELIVNHETGETKTFYQPSTIRGKAARVGIRLAKKLEAVDKEQTLPEDEMIDEMLQYIAEYGYNNQFTADELEDGIDSRDLFQTLGNEVGAILNRMGEDGDKPGKPTKAKKD